MTQYPEDPKPRLNQERYRLLHKIEEWLEGPMIVLGFIWLILLIIELIRGLSPFLQSVSNVIWALFVVDFMLRFAIAPSKTRYLRRNVMTAISLVVPALRIFRIARAFRILRLARAGRGLRLLKVVGSLNRGMGALGKTMQRRGGIYVLLLTVTVTLVGAAGMLAFERSLPDGQGLNDYGSALWWTAMIMTTLGSEYWPHTAEGRLLCLLLAFYSAAVFGYITASLATFFIERDAISEDTELAGAGSMKELRDEIAALRMELRAVLVKSTPAPDEE